MGWSARKPVKENDELKNGQSIVILTSNWKFGAAGDELQEVPATSSVISGHDLDQVTYRFALDIESVISLDGFVQS